jgi:c-di-GMP-binding flagellar brake protein YcgR
MDERRRAKRIKLNINIEYDISEYQKWVEAQSRNLSENGICIITGKELAVGSVVQLKFTLPDTDVPLQVTGKVIWNEFSLDEDYYIQGLEFTGLSPDNLELVRKYISATTFDKR